MAVTVDARAGGVALDSCRSENFMPVPVSILKWRNFFKFLFEHCPTGGAYDPKRDGLLRFVADRPLDAVLESVLQLFHRRILRPLGQPGKHKILWPYASRSAAVRRPFCGTLLTVSLVPKRGALSQFKTPGWARPETNHLIVEYLDLNSFNSFQIFRILTSEISNFQFFPDLGNVRSDQVLLARLPRNLRPYAHHAVPNRPDCRASGDDE